MATLTGPATERLREIAILAVAYGVTGAIGLLLAIPPGYATSVWPPSGIALAGLLRFGPRVWPGVWLGSFAVNTWVALNATHAEFGNTAVVVAASIAAGSTLQALLGAYFLRRWIGVDRIFEYGPAVFGFAAVMAICCLVAATWGTTTLQLAGLLANGAYFDSWRTWWLGDVIGVLVFAPALLNWRQFLPAGTRRWKRLETAGALALLVALTTLVFFGQPSLTGVAYPLTFVPLPFLVWIACTTTPGVVAIATGLVSAIAIVATSQGAGPFAFGTTHASLLLLQGFTGLTTLTGLALSAAVTGHRAAEDSLRTLSSELHHLALTDDLTGLRNRRGFLMFADQARKLARRTRAKSLLVFIDIDGLKVVNDSLGHRAGDALLVDAARVLTAVFRDTDVIGRVGGDEFAVLALAEGGNAPDTISRRLESRIRELNAQPGRAYALSMSHGIQELPAAVHLSLDEQLAKADHAMYQRKRAQAERKPAGRAARRRGGIVRK